MQSVSGNLEPSILADTLAKTSLRGNTDKIASVIVTCCKYVIEQVRMNGVTDVKQNLEETIKSYIKIRLAWLENGKNHNHLCIVDESGLIVQTGICFTIIRETLFLWLWKNPQCFLIEAN